MPVLFKKVKKIGNVKCNVAKDGLSARGATLIRKYFPLSLGDLNPLGYLR